MKRNVDLTDNRIFSNDQFNGVLLSSIVIDKGHPWDAHMVMLRSDDDLDMDHQRKAIIAVGNKETRAEVKLLREMDSPNYCDCCGERMNIKPWNREIGICCRCENMIVEKKDRCKWRKNDSKAIISTIF